MATVNGYRGGHRTRRKVDDTTARIMMIIFWIFVASLVVAFFIALTAK